MGLINGFNFICLTSLVICNSCVFAVEVEAGLKISNSNESDHYVADKKEVIKLPTNKSTNNSENENKFENRKSEYSLEGGGLSSTTMLKDVGLQTESELSHSKGRKGVAHQGSSVVPRKGVDILETQSVNNSLLGSKSIQESSTSNSDKLVSRENSTEGKQNLTSPNIPHEQVSQQVVQAKKPEAVSDLGDVNDDEANQGGPYYYWPYILLFALFCFLFCGAFTVYRSAGEYWDRRHYQRMDFLVEGMYND